MSQFHRFANVDAYESVMFERQLEYVKAQTYDIEYPDLKATQLIPVSTEAGPAAEVIVYTQYDRNGIAKVIANYADDLPRADVKGRQFTAPVRSLGTSYGYSLQELRASVMMKKNLPMAKAEAARAAIDELINSIGWNGSSKDGLVGFINNPNITRTSAPNDGTGSSTKFVDKTPVQIIRDLNALCDGINVVSKGKERPDTLILPLSQYNYLRRTQYSTNYQASIMKVFMDDQQFIKNVEWANEMKDAGIGVDGGVAAGQDIAIAYHRDPRKLQFEIPVFFEQLGVQERGLEYLTNCHARVGGVSYYYPLSGGVLEGI